MVKLSYNDKRKLKVVGITIVKGCLCISSEFEDLLRDAVSKYSQGGIGKHVYLQSNENNAISLDTTVTTAGLYYIFQSVLVQCKILNGCTDVLDIDMLYDYYGFKYEIENNILYLEDSLYQDYYKETEKPRGLFTVISGDNSYRTNNVSMIIILKKLLKQVYFVDSLDIFITLDRYFNSAKRTDEAALKLYGYVVRDDYMMLKAFKDNRDKVVRDCTQKNEGYLPLRLLIDGTEVNSNLYIKSYYDLLKIERHYLRERS